MSSDTEEESLVELQPQPQPEVVDLVSSDTEPESLVCKWRLAAYQRKLNTLQVRNLKSTLQSLPTPNPSHQVSRQARIWRALTFSVEITPVKALASSTTANVQRLVNTERPSKIRRVSGVEFAKDDTSTPRPNENVRPGYKVPQTDPGKAARPSDYSVYKGKGRYNRKSDAGPRCVYV